MPKYIPYYCGMVRKVIVTPTTSYILIPTMETSHRVIRHFHDIIEIPDMIVRNGFTFSDGSTNVKDNQVQVRPSQHKFESHYNVLEVIRGIPDEVFIELKDLRVRKLDKMLESEHTALDILQGMSMNMEFQSHLLNLSKRDF
ncbi:hypothetical protein RhiirA1_454870 [Rhizophagus irregularis]|uniref:RNA-directed RNA polymerase n=1 Tax=Rhizophagus irregularis TaxID=588596 RepID=A0A2N0S468_9GLOM|nr:hypothetical protein RhiirA1_461811 [Rhizophagus irregularis]PKC70348.1 hypothetical protein RhiirA1_454870 [Rhizophagus irregularis]